MYVHNLDPTIFDLGFFSLRWYSLAYIIGIILGWWYGKKIIFKLNVKITDKLKLSDFDDLVSYIIISIIIGGRIGYVLFYNINYYFYNPIEIFQIWKGGMSFHGALLGIIIGTYLFSVKRNISVFLLLDIVACVSPIGIFFGRIANFINGELVGKVTNLPWGVTFPNIDLLSRHPSQLYEALLEGLILFLIMNVIILKKNYITGTCSYLFLIFYGAFRIFSEIFREPDLQIGYLFDIFSMGTLLSLLMIISGILILFKKK